MRDRIAARAQFTHQLTMQAVCRCLALTGIGSALLLLAGLQVR